jgi:hypothetical protein
MSVQAGMRAGTSPRANDSTSARIVAKSTADQKVGETRFFLFFLSR